MERSRGTRLIVIEAVKEYYDSRRKGSGGVELNRMVGDKGRWFIGGMVKIGGLKVGGNYRTKRFRQSEKKSFRPTTVIYPEAVKDLYSNWRRAKERKEITTLAAPHPPCFRFSHFLTTAQPIPGKLLQFTQASLPHSAEII